MRSRGTCSVHHWADRRTHWQTWVTCFSPLPLCLCLCRSGSLKARLCSTWSAASAWTVRPPLDPRSFCSVAPRWLDSPGSHRLSPDAQWDGDGRWWSLQKDSGEHVCTLGQKKKKRSENSSFVMSSNSSSLGLAGKKRLWGVKEQKHTRSICVQSFISAGCCSSST